MASNSNTQRVLRGIVSLEAWHDTLSEDYPTVDLFASIRFNVSRFGQDPDDKIQFTLTLKNAQLVVIPDESGVLNIPNRHVRRDKRHVSVTSETTRASTQGTSADVSGTTELSKGTAKAHLKMKAKAKAANTADQTTTMKQSEHGIISEHAKDGEHHSWLFSPSMGHVLDGHGWQDDLAIMKVRHTKPSSISGEQFPPYVKVQVKCFADDLDIDEVQYLDRVSKIWLPFQDRKKLDLAREVIKEELQKEGLLRAPKTEVDLNKKNTALIVAEIVAVKELSDV